MEPRQIYRDSIGILWKIHRIVQTNPKDPNYHHKLGFLCINTALCITLINYVYTVMIYQPDFRHKMLSLAYFIIALQVAYFQIWLIRNNLKRWLLSSRYPSNIGSVIKCNDCLEYWSLSMKYTSKMPPVMTVSMNCARATPNWPEWLWYQHCVSTCSFFWRWCCRQPLNIC